MSEQDTPNEISPESPEASPARTLPAGLWPAFWSLLAAAFSFAAAIGAFNHEGRYAILNGGMALACSLAGVMLNRWQAAHQGDEVAPLARIPLVTMNLLAFAVLFLSGALLVELSHKGWRGVDFFGDQLIWKEGARDMALALGLVFAALAALGWALRNNQRWSPRRSAVTAGVAAVLTLLLGPTITFESLEGGDLDDRALFYKYSVIDLFGPADAVSLYADVTQENGEERPVICVAQESSRFLIFGTRSNAERRTSYDDPLSSHQAALCEAEVEAAMSSGRAVEGLLFKENLSGFFARMRALPAATRQRQLFVHLERLPAPLGQQLENYLPKVSGAGFTAFDVALAVGDKESALALMPQVEGLLPHQRQGLFSAGAAQAIAGLGGETEESLARQRRDTYQTMMGIGMQLGSADLMRSAITSLVMSSFRDGQYADYKGGYTDFDFYLANRHCDVDYAKFLLDQQHQPTASHLLHLLSIVGLAQYPGSGNGYSQSFKYADTSLGLPDANQLARCEALGAFYGEHVKDFNRAGSGSSIVDAYTSVYDQMRGAVDEWWTRDRDRRQMSASADARLVAVQGDPAVAVNTAVAFLKAQPPSFEQICAWTNSAYTWNRVVAKSNPEMTAAVREMSAQWRNARTLRKGADEICTLRSPYSVTDDYETPAGAIRYIDRVLAQSGLPCRTRVDQYYGNVLACNARMEAWE